MQIKIAHYTALETAVYILLYKAYYNEFYTALYTPNVYCTLYCMSYWNYIPLLSALSTETYTPLYITLFTVLKAAF